MSYGHGILREVCEDVSSDFKDLGQLIWNMKETLYAAGGIGLAASQIDKAIRLFIVDTRQVYDSINDEIKKTYFPNGEGIREVFINATLVTGTTDNSYEAEGCLSIPSVNESVTRSKSIIINYQDPAFQSHTRTFRGITARAIQHELDHTKGILFIDHLSPVKKRALGYKLRQITKGRREVEYRMKFAKT